MYVYVIYATDCMQIFMIYGAFRDVYNSDDERTLSYHVNEELYAINFVCIIFSSHSYHTAGQRPKASIASYLLSKTTLFKQPNFHASL